MLKVVVAVKDRAADCFGQPFFVGTDNIAIRSFMDEVNRKDDANQLFNHADDFDLFGLGTYDDNTGIITMYDAPKLIMLGKSAKNS
jgi:hypothetical protein